MLIEVEANSGVRTLVNPANITFVQDDGTTCFMHFVGGSTLPLNMRAPAIRRLIDEATAPDAMPA